MPDHRPLRWLGPNRLIKRCDENSCCVHCPNELSAPAWHSNCAFLRKLNTLKDLQRRQKCIGLILATLFRGYTSSFSIYAFARATSALLVPAQHRIRKLMDQSSWQSAERRCIRSLWIVSALD